MVRQLITKKGL